jgi:hypothetical protein
MRTWASIFLSTGGGGGGADADAHDILSACLSQLTHESINRTIIRICGW